ncbi:MULTISPECIES: major capsid protein [Acinetobacter]|uniref:major capsid protein n=1 Tax=Acinetobacter TaxID=469 RepID=UPI00092BCEA3|nr:MULTISPECIES: major capsid protein [Acinetobacter]MCU4562009.1 hypothetical protein [Acinetobacter sp. WU_MDCI_Abxc222]OJK08005.1 hypothetical protein BRY75_04445 [Acinetobacter baumannii]
MALQNVEVIQQEAHKKTWFQRFRTSAKYAPVALGSALAMSGANAAVTMPTIDTGDIITFIGVVLAAVATIGAAWIMVPLAAKGIKALIRAF